MLQGLLAGLNAARRAHGREPVVLPRDSSYIGTLVDDLVTKVRRMFAPRHVCLLLVPFCGTLLYRHPR